MGMLRMLLIAISLSVIAGCSSDDDGSKSDQTEKDKDDAGLEEDDDGKEDDDKKPSAGSAGAMDDEDTPESCADLKCGKMATCDDSGDEPVCVCPDGYKEVDGDCEDVDECKDDDLNDCAPQADCENTDGGYTCSCPAPAYKGDGKKCSCGEGYAPDPDRDNRCLGKNGSACEVNANCESKSCVDKICCSEACDTPDNCQTEEGVTCKDGTTCEYPQAPVGASCNDGDACTDDVCDEAGACIGTAFDPLERCSKGSGCQAPSCDTALGCIYTNVAAGTACDDGDPCTTSDACDAQGACLGAGLPAECDDGNECTVDSCTPGDDGAAFTCVQENREGSCGPPDACATEGVCSEGACEPVGNTCGAGDPSCLPGPPKVCQCAEPEYVLDTASGVCIPNDNDCVTGNPCAPNATCTDPSSAPNDATCACAEGLIGDGRADGSGCSACESPLSKAVNGACVCDLAGTFATQVESRLSWEEGTFEEASDVATLSWSLRTHTYDSAGNLVVTERACGGTTPDLCVPILREAMSGSIPNSVYDSGRVPAATFAPVSIPRALPGQPFHTPPVAALVGISLPASQALTSWPASWETPGVNWIDADQDGPLGVTTFWRGTGTSTTCPRDGVGSYDYAHVPVPVGLRVYRVQEVYGASRMISSLDGTFADCDTITGDVHGRNASEPYQVDARALGCKLDNGQDCASVDTEIVDFLDGESEASPQQVDSAKFVIKRMPAGMAATCENARAMDFSVP